MYIEKTNDRSFPYRINGSWEQSISCDREELIELKKEIDRVLDEPQEPQPRVSNYGSIGGQMVRKMIEHYERSRK